MNEKELANAWTLGKELAAQEKVRAMRQVVPPDVYEVIVGNVGQACTTDHFQEAKACYDAYVVLSNSGTTRAAYESVYLMKNGHPVEEHHYE
jgi:hypothetical protein